MRLLRTLAALAVLLALAACTDDEPGPRDPSSTWSPSGTMETPSPSAGQTPTEPALPDAATQASEDGARAFITYYWDLINYAQVTGDVKALKAASGPNCEGCKAGIDGIRQLYKGGGHAEGGEYTVTFDKVNQLKGDSTLVAFEALLTVANAEQLRVQGDGSEHRSAEGSSQMAVAAQWAADSWRMEVMNPQ
ncbi:DUF6318 family protein [Nocardioides humi]|uniref:DUF6318 domain-containing protein n=1 Tax=Nocardioides humi TaxID=449461 RepID=A0ABN2BT00_9ACTN|nr:DUF6318 family protein [Nocardioides humi]